VTINQFINNLKEICEERRVHLIIQSLNGVQTNLSKLTNSSQELIALMDQDNINLLDNENISKEDLILLVTITSILPGGNNSLDQLEIQSLNNSLKVLESFEHDNYMVSLFKID
tara:strand:- start:278 stop:619 length:342 start_codon:yes stop_codon:yes gene_type:complete